MKKLRVEVADTPIKREYGLMDRKKLSENDGMLFKFPYATNLSFWMKDTYIPLEIAFINDDGKIIQIEEMFPLSTRATTSIDKCKYALEVNRGWFRKNNIKKGAYIFGKGIFETNLKNKTAQNIGTLEIPQQNVQNAQPEIQPDIILNKTFKDILMDAEKRGNDLILIYQTKSGIVLPPKLISPPFTFEPNADGKHDAVVKAWDNQTAGWKSFLLDNIIDLEEKPKEVVKEKVKI